MTDAEIYRQQARDEFRRTMGEAEKANTLARQKISDLYAQTLARATRKYLEALELADNEDYA